jgi:hypothetical protein
MTKGRVALPGRVVAEQEPFCIVFGWAQWPMTPSVEINQQTPHILAASVQQLLFPGSAALPFVISTGAHPDFLLRAAGNDQVCGSP